MLAPNDPPVVAPAPLSETHRRQLWRTFHAWTGDRTVAEDLTQETLVAAWQSSQCPASEPDLTRWLFGVARNVLRRHRREQGRIGNAHVDLPDDDAAFALASDSLDLDATLERDEIVSLLDAALSRLPAESRRALLLRYIDDLPQREVADRLGINEKTLEGKLHRGKRAMHRYLVTDGVEQARSLGLVALGDDWQVTNFWCDACGLQRLFGRWLPDGGLHLECPSCTILGGGRSNHTYIDGGITGGLRSFGAASRRVSDYFHDWSLSGMLSLRVCPDCGRIVDIVPASSWSEDFPEYRLRCSNCLRNRYVSAIGVTGCHPAYRLWLKREQRVVLDVMAPTASVEHDGCDALHLRWYSRTSSSVYEALRDRETLRYLLIAIDGKPLAQESLAQ